MKTTVIGSGVAGLCCAYELACRSVDVTVLESGRLGAGASAGNAGWVTPFLSAPRAAPGAVGHALRGTFSAAGPARIRPHAEVAFLAWVCRFLLASRPAAYQRGLVALQRLAGLAQGAYESLAHRGVRFQQYSGGLAIVAKTERNYRRYAALAVAMKVAGYNGDVRCLRGADITEFEPAVRRDVFGVVHVVGDAHVRPETLTDGLVLALRTGGSPVHEFSTATSVCRRRNRWVVSTHEGVDYLSDSVLVAAGFGTRRILQGMGIKIPLEAAQGISLTASGVGTVPRHPLKLSEDMVACSPFGAAVRMSGAFDLGARGIGIDRRRLHAIVERGLDYLHDWRPTRVQSCWAGHRPTTPDDLPVIGEVPGQPGLYIVTGHGTLGVTLGPITGRLVAMEMTGSSACEILRPFRLSRFGGDRGVT